MVVRTQWSLGPALIGINGSCHVFCLTQTVWLCHRPPTCTLKMTRHSRRVWPPLDHRPSQRPRREPRRLTAQSARLGTTKLIQEYWDPNFVQSAPTTTQNDRTTPPLPEEKEACTGGATMKPLAQRQRGVGLETPDHIQRNLERLQIHGRTSRFVVIAFVQCTILIPRSPLMPFRFIPKDVARLD